jgi:hypothetical protein
MNGTIEAKRVKSTETASTFHGFSRCGQGAWTNGTVVLTPTYANGGRFFVASIDGEKVNAFPTLADAVTYWK